jgi:hypothetical protein
LVSYSEFFFAALDRGAAMARAHRIAARAVSALQGAESRGLADDASAPGDEIASWVAQVQSEREYVRRLIANGVEPASAAACARRAAACLQIMRSP